MIHTKLPPSNEDLQAERSLVRQSIEEILSEIEQAMRDAGLHYPIALAVPSSGDAIMTILTTDNPPDQDWSQITDMACGTLSRRLRDIRLHSRRLPCAITKTEADAADRLQAPM